MHKVSLRPWRTLPSPAGLHLHALRPGSDRPFDSKAARFWYWMLQNSSSINDSNPGLVQIFAASTPEHKRKMGERFLELRYSDGQTPVFRRRSNALSIQDYALIGLGALGLVLVCGVAAVLRYYSHKRHLINIAGFASKISDFDTESPALKAIKYLEVRYRFPSWTAIRH